MSETKRRSNPTGPNKASDMRQGAESGGQMAEGMHRAHSNLPECSRWQPMAQEETRRTPKGGEGAMRSSMRKQHYNITPQKELAMTKHIS